MTSPICLPCKRAFVQVAELLSALKDESLSPAAEAKARKMAVTLMVIGEHLTVQEIERMGVGNGHQREFP